MILFKFEEQKIPAFAQRLAKQGRYAAKLTLNETATALREEAVKDLAYGFDRPTPWVLRGIYARYSKDGSDSAFVGVNDLYTNKQGRAQFNTLSPHFNGGDRHLKAFERALQRIGLMPAGWYATIGSGAGRVGGEDAYGNLKASFIVQIMSYLQAFGEQGYRANATPATIKRREKVGRTAQGYRTINGWAFFVSRPGFRMGRGAWRDGRANHLPPGIWAKHGTHGAEVVPVVMFVRHVSYRKRLDFDARAKDVAAQIPDRYKRNLAKAMETAR